MKAIVIVANGWHAGWLGCYGNEWLRTHNLDRLASESIVFDQHFAVAPDPANWFHSIATGRYSFDAASPSPDLLVSLQKYGIRTVRVHDLKEQSPANVPSFWSESIALTKSAENAPGEAIYLRIDQCLQELAATDNWLLWIETDRFVPPWDVSMDFFDEYAQDMAFLEGDEEPQPWDQPPIGPRHVTDRELERLQTTFASVITEWDVELAEWFELFREHGLNESAAWIFTSGFGLSLGEHGWIGPTGHRPFEELGHMPLLVRLPNGEQGGRRVSLLTASIDLMPSIHNLFDVSTTVPNHGKSLLGLARGSSVPIHPFVCQQVNAQGQQGRAIRTPEWALLKSADKVASLFRKPEDRWEVNDLYQQHLEWAEYLESVLKNQSANPDESRLLKSYDEVMASTAAQENPK